MPQRWVGLVGALGSVCVALGAVAATRKITAATVTSASTQMLEAVSGSRLFLSINNESATATIACAFSATAAANTAGSYTIGPGATRTWGPGTYEVPGAPGGAVNCISSAATSPATIESIP